MTGTGVISAEAVIRRRHWISEIVKISGQFGPDVARAATELAAEEASVGVQAVVDHLRLCGAIPEEYGHDSSEEKLYSKYTDAVIALAFNQLGCRAVVLTERADAADVEVFSPNFSLVADAKAFRLSRTAKNQKDFKVQAMDGWRRDKKFAVVVSPLYQLPSSSSQIYLQAISRDVCLLSYSHLAVMVRHAAIEGPEAANRMLALVLNKVVTLPPSKSAVDYWTAVNSVMLSAHEGVRELWKVEKLANLEAIALAKEEALVFLASVRTEIMGLSHEAALARLIHAHKIDGRERTIRAVSDNGLLALST